MASRAIGSLNGKVRRVSLEGIIGAGKSVFLGCLRERLARNRETVLVIVDEPVSDWCKTKDSDGKSVLEHFYDDTRRYSFLFQVNALMTRYSATTCADDVVKSDFLDSRCAHAPELPRAEPTPPAHPYVILSERTINTDREVFARMLHDDGYLNSIEHEVYCNTYDTLTARRPDAAKTDGTIYIHTTPTEALTRIKKRNRPGEDVGFEYLCKCQAAHDDWLASVDHPVLIVDGAIDAAHTRYGEALDIAECYLINDAAAPGLPLPTPIPNWDDALRSAEATGMAIYDKSVPSPAGEEVEGIAFGLPIGANVVDTVGGITEHVPEETPLEEPAPVYACD
jgi:deoxyguanosine kinase